MTNNTENNKENNIVKRSIIKKKKVFDIFEYYHVDADELGFLSGVEYPGFLFERTITSIKDTVTFSFENTLLEETACPNILAVADLFGIDYIVDRAEEFKKNGKDIEIYEGIMDSIRKPQKIDFSNIENFEDEDFDEEDFDDEDDFEDFDDKDFEEDDEEIFEDDESDEGIEDMNNTNNPEDGFMPLPFGLDDDIPFDDAYDDELDKLRRTFREMMESDNASKNTDNSGNKSSEN